MNKGFTLVELIAVVTILGLLAIITTPAYDTVSRNIKTRNYDSKRKAIEAQTLSYVEKYLKNETYDGSDSTHTLCFTVDYLIKNGIVSSDSETEEYIENDLTGEKYSGTYIKVYYDLDSLKLIALTQSNDTTDNKYQERNCDSTK